MSHKEIQSNARELDQFYTAPDIAKTCIDFARKRLSHLNFQSFVEPSAGAGAFSNEIGQSCIAIDLDPKCAGAIQADFLKWQPASTEGAQLVIGNPPFGKNASLAVRFFNHAAGFADAIAFIVPLSFRKASVQKRLDRNFHLVETLQLPEEAFIFEGKSYAVPCEFQVWERREEARVVEKPVRKHADFEFCSREEADFAVQRIGANAGRIKDAVDAGSNSSHFFIRSTAAAENLRAHFEQIDFDEVRFHTAGVPSISKAEIVALYAKQVALKARDVDVSERVDVSLEETVAVIGTIDSVAHIRSQLTKASRRPASPVAFTGIQVSSRREVRRTPRTSEWRRAYSTLVFRDQGVGLAKLVRRGFERKPHQTRLQIGHSITVCTFSNGMGSTKRCLGPPYKGIGGLGGE